jgi:hypothetical protein
MTPGTLVRNEKDELKYDICGTDSNIFVDGLQKTSPYCDIINLYSDIIRYEFHRDIDYIKKFIDGYVSIFSQEKEIKDEIFQVVIPIMLSKMK